MNISRLLFLGLIILLILIPPSSFTSVKVAYISFFLVVFMFFFLYLGMPNIKESGLYSFILGLVLVLALILLDISFGNDYSLKLGAKYLLFYTLISIGIYLLNNGWLKVKTFYLVILYSVVSYMILKNIIMFLPFLGIVTSNEIFSIVKFYVGSSTLGYWGAEGVFFRMSFGGDIVVIFTLYFFLINDVLRSLVTKAFEGTFILNGILFSLLTFTRFYWIVILFALIVFLARNATIKYLSYIIFMAFLLFLVNWEVFVGLFENLIVRLLDFKSTDVKAEQSRFLISAWEEAPLMGRGISFYVPEYFRGMREPYTYEVQWLALLMQIGIVGLMGVGYYMSKIIPNNLLNKKNILISVGYLFFILSAFTNPYLFVSSSAVIYLLIYALYRGRV